MTKTFSRIRQISHKHKYSQFQTISKGILKFIATKSRIIGICRLMRKCQITVWGAIRIARIIQWYLLCKSTNKILNKISKLMSSRERKSWKQNRRNYDLSRTTRGKSRRNCAKTSKHRVGVNLVQPVHLLMEDMKWGRSTTWIRCSRQNRARPFIWRASVNMVGDASISMKK